MHKNYKQTIKSKEYNSNIIIIHINKILFKIYLKYTYRLACNYIIF